MEEKIKKLQEPLGIEDIDFRVQSVSTKGYVTLLAYKNARVDMDRLDKSVGAMNWKREHTRENHNCIISIWDDEKKHWVPKEDTGVESFSEKEKGLASDSFKGAGFNWGIGKELYNYPFIFLQLYPNEFKVEGTKAKTTFDFKLDKWKWDLNMKDGKVIKLTAHDQNGRLRFDSTRDFNCIPKDGQTTAQQPQQTAPKQTPPPKQEKPKNVSGKLKMSDAVYQKAMQSEKIDVLTKALTTYDLTTDQMGNISLRIEALKEKQGKNQ